MVTPFLKPALNDDFAFGKKANSFLTLGVQYAIEGILHATEWEECHRGYYTDIYAHIATDDPVLKLPGIPAAWGENRIAIAEITRVT